jgi:hypothetical protein
MKNLRKEGFEIGGRWLGEALASMPNNCDEAFEEFESTTNFSNLSVGERQSILEKALHFLVEKQEQRRRKK